MERRASVMTGPTVTIAENVIHPAHDGVVGDLVRNISTGQYFMLEYIPDADRYTKHSVPHAWAVRQDPRNTVVDQLHRSIPSNDYSAGNRETAETAALSDE